MCILITTTASNLRRVFFETAGLIDSIYERNSDGLGLMFMSDDGVPTALKHLPANLADAHKWLFDNVPTDERPIAMHARFATHGHVDLHNCHPYPLDGGWLMHNGVLSISTKADESRSDTYHYATSFLEGQADNIFASAAGRRLLGDHIGSSNKFAYLATDGQIHVVNRSAGVEYEGMWFSNTYAWDVGLLDTTWYRHSSYTSYTSGDPRRAKASKSTKRGVLDADDVRYLGHLHEDAVPEHGWQPSVENWTDESGSCAWLLWHDSDLLAEALDECGDEIINAIMDEMGEARACSPATGDAAFDLAVKAIVDEDLPELRAMLSDGMHDTVADAIVYGVTWVNEYAPSGDPELSDVDEEFEDVPF